MSQGNEYSYKKEWQIGEKIEAAEMNDISSALERLVEEENNFINNFPKISENNTDKKNDIGTHIKEYIDGIIKRNESPQTDTQFNPTSINWDVTPPAWDTNLYYTDTEQTAINSIHSLEKRCDHLEKIITLIGKQLMGVSNSSTGVVANAKQWATSTSPIEETIQTEQDTTINITDYSAKRYAGVAKDWAISTAETIDGISGHSAKYYSDHADTVSSHVDAINTSVSSVYNTICSDFYWSGESDLVIENRFVIGELTSTGRNLIFSLDVNKILPPFVTGEVTFNNLTAQQNISIVTGLEEGDAANAPAFDIICWGAGYWGYKQESLFNPFSKISNLQQKIAVGSDKHTLIINLRKESDWAWTIYNNKNANAKIKQAQVSIFIKKLVLRYTPPSTIDNETNNTPNP